MGVDGLLKFLQPIIKKEHLSSFRQKTAAIDMMSWLYRALYNSADQMRDDPQSNVFLIYLHQMIDLLHYYSIKMICVFDGRFLKHKEKTILRRRIEKQNNKKKGQQLITKGDEQSGKKYMNRCINIDERILSTTIRMLRGRNIQYIISPYESDCQMAKLYQLSMIDFTICQDSDLVIYGVPVLLKLSNEGDCDYFDINRVNPKQVDNVFIKDFVNLTKIRKVEVAVLTGTDYLPSIKGIGIKRAIKFITESTNLEEAVNNIGKIQKFKSQIPENYLQKVQEALAIFFISTVYNPQTEKLEFLMQNTVELVQVMAKVSIENLKTLAGQDYGYTEEVRNGSKQVWTLQPRDLSPLQYNGKSMINQSALRDKELMFSNLKVVEGYFEEKSPIIHKDFQEENELQMMCENRQALQKKEELIKLKLKLEQDLKKEEEQYVTLKRCTSQEKFQQFRQKFPQWMTYCPQELPPDKNPLF